MTAADADVAGVTSVSDNAAGAAVDDDLLAGLASGGAALPFNRHLGVEVVELAIGRCVTRLRDDPALHNHLAGVHAIAELAPVELAGALAVSSRLRTLLERGFVPVVGGLSVRYTAPAAGELRASAEVGAEVIDPALAAADAGRKPRIDVEVEVTDAADVVVARAQLTFFYLDVAADTS
jgi:acyl-coenzyme A thioesterase PaaI-like protein